MAIQLITKVKVRRYTCDACGKVENVLVEPGVTEEENSGFSGHTKQTGLGVAGAVASDWWACSAKCIGKAVENALVAS